MWILILNKFELCIYAFFLTVLYSYFVPSCFEKQQVFFLKKKGAYMSEETNMNNPFYSVCMYFLMILHGKSLFPGGESDMNV